jgi:cell wall-associated NlpC family hydrolase
MHWARPLIGKPYKAGAAGPDAFDCLGLVRYYLQTVKGRDLPAYSLGDADPAGILAFTRAAGWRRVAGEPQNEDLLLMDNVLGRHIGVVVKTCEGLGLLHAAGSEGAGSVVWQPLHTLVAYRNKAAWRATCST